MMLTFFFVISLCQISLQQEKVGGVSIVIMVPKSSRIVRGVCANNGDVLPEAAIPADREEHFISGRTGAVG